MKIEKNKTLIIESESEEKSLKIGREIGAKLQPGDFIALDGDLGMGKTLITAGIVYSLGIKREEVSSPTYTIMKPYLNGAIPVYHWDFYRINSSEELYIADFHELLYEKKSVFIVEWASLFKEVWKDYFPRYEITITKGATSNDRTFSLIHKG